MAKQIVHDGYPVISDAQARKVAETLIPDELRAYVATLEVENSAIGVGTALDYDVYIGFFPPVVGSIDDARYIRCPLANLKQEITEMKIDLDSYNDPDYEEYDEGVNGMTVLTTRKHTINFDWEKSETKEAKDKQEKPTFVLNITPSNLRVKSLLLPINEAFVGEAVETARKVFEKSIDQFEAPSETVGATLLIRADYVGTYIPLASWNWEKGEIKQVEAHKLNTSYRLA